MASDYRQVNTTKPICELDYENSEIEWGYLAS